MINGIFPIYKVSGPTSHDIINQLRKITGIKKIGHAGTLDPLAFGVMVVGIGRPATKLLGYFSQCDKDYLATIKLGFISNTDDANGEIAAINSNKRPSLEQIEKKLSGFLGVIMQTPPDFSAVKVHGRPAHRIMRQGSQVKLSPRAVELKKVDIINYQWPLLKISLTTGAGFYVRALARDLGQSLGVGGYIVELERTRVGSFPARQAVTPEQFKNFIKQ